MANKHRAFAQMKHESILGATKDIAALKASYDKIMERVVKKYGKFDETVFEQDEKEYFIRRAYRQAARDMRMTGSITTGEQKLLEETGIEPLEAQRDIAEYLNGLKQRIANGEIIPLDDRNKWLDGIVEKYLPKTTQKLARLGETDEHLYKLEQGE